MKTRLSGLMDGELAEHEAQVLFAALRQDDELRGRWLEYQLIGDTLKGEKDLSTEMTARVMGALDAEPTVLAPRSSLRPEPWHRSALALAATLAGVAVVGWLALGTGQSVKPETVAQVTAPQREASAVSAVQPVREASLDMQEYLMSHEAQSSSLQFRGGAEHIRTVSVIETANSK
ncbi:MAG: sigma-E factor negative regulatory protein [Rhodocyclaceae bacterium]|nr:sigma-E factor negative regulatory protein [Rhodocyclaceae bacterium]